MTCTAPLGCCVDEHAPIGVLPLAAVTGCLWFALLAAFSFVSVAAQCGGAPGGGLSVFLVAGSALALGALGAGALSDRLGRTYTARVLLFLSSSSTLLAAVLRPGDAGLQLVLAASAGIAAGGSHVTAENFLEHVPGRFRAGALLCFPVMFFPCGLISEALLRLGWVGGACLAALLCAAAGVGLSFLPESSCFERVRSARRAGGGGGGEWEGCVIVEEEEAEEGEGGEEGVLGGAGGGAGAVGVGLASPPADDAVGGRRGSSPAEDGEALALLPGGGGGGRRAGSAPPSPTAPPPPPHRGVGALLPALTVLLWVLFISVYYLSGLLFQAAAVAGLDGDSGSGGVAPAAVREEAALLAAFCGSALPAVEGAPGGGGGGGAPRCASPASAFQVSGGHLVVAEVSSLVLVVACSLLLPTVGRKWTLSLAFSLAAGASLLAFVFLPSLSCGEDAWRLALEFLVRACVAGSGQALFLFTVEVAPTSLRGTAAGLALAAFRCGALLSLASSLSPGSEARLQWSVYALRAVEGGFGGLPAGSAEHGAAVRVALAACSQACLLAACLTACLPVDTADKALRDRTGSPFVGVEVGEPRRGAAAVTEVEGRGAAAGRRVSALALLWGGGAGRSGGGAAGSPPPPAALPHAQSGGGGAAARGGTRGALKRQRALRGGGAGVWEPLSTLSPAPAARAPQRQPQPRRGEALHGADPRGGYRALPPPPPHADVTPRPEPVPQLNRLPRRVLAAAAALYSARALRRFASVSSGGGGVAGGTTGTPPRRGAPRRGASEPPRRASPHAVDSDGEGEVAVALFTLQGERRASGLLLRDASAEGALALFSPATQAVQRARDAAGAAALAARMLEETERGGGGGGGGGGDGPPAALLTLEEEAIRLLLLARLWAAEGSAPQ
jgi:hypothetical protein